MRRVVILDEVHAYDAYMRRELERLLEFQAGLGGSAILLSATLPQSARKRLVDAFAKGLGTDAMIEGPSNAYPMATICADAVASSAHVSGQPGRARKLPVRLVSTQEEALDRVEKAACAGQAVLYIRNTVDDALKAYKALWARKIEPIIFHARFALADHLNRERQIMETFGKSSQPEERRGRVLVEAVYGDDVHDSVPAGLIDSLWEAEGREGAERSMANYNVLDLAKGYMRDAGAWDADVRTPTRLDDDPRVTLRLGRLVQGQIQPYALEAAPDELWRAWRLSEVSLPARRVGGEANPLSVYAGKVKHQYRQ